MFLQSPAAAITLVGLTSVGLLGYRVAGPAGVFYAWAAVPVMVLAWAVAVQALTQAAAARRASRYARRHTVPAGQPINLARELGYTNPVTLRRAPELTLHADGPVTIHQPQDQTGTYDLSEVEQVIYQEDFEPFSDLTGMMSGAVYTSVDFLGETLGAGPVMKWDPMLLALPEVRAHLARHLPATVSAGLPGNWQARTQTGPGHTHPSSTQQPTTLGSEYGQLSWDDDGIPRVDHHRSQLYRSAA